MEFACGMVAAIVLIIIGLIGMSETDSVVSKKELFERGLMVQCLGKEGYYWECE